MAPARPRAPVRLAVALCLGASVFSAGTFLTIGSANAEPASKVYLNGVPSPVYFNDGDSFRVLAGRYSGTKARLAGYNTLESYGNVHRWGTKTFEELYANAKQGTLNARRGPCWDDAALDWKKGCTGAWHCTSDLKRDGYGRILWWCPDLAYDQVRKGLAHVMSVRGPGKPKLVEAQKLAVAERVGMWSRGVPEYVVTSLHSWDEPYAKEYGSAYNRLVSVADGHSQKWLHHTEYQECDVVCRKAVTDVAAIAKAAADLRGEASVAAIAKIYDDKMLTRIVRRYAEIGEVYFTTDKAHIAPLAAVLVGWRKSGRLGKLVDDSCMRYAGFTRRYGRNAAGCLH